MGEPEHDIKIFRLSSRKLIDTISKSPDECLKQIKRYLPELHYEKLSVLVEEYKKMDNLLSRKHSSVEDFCTIKKFLIEADERLKEMQDRSNSITELKFIMQEN